MLNMLKVFDALFKALSVNKIIVVIERLCLTFKIPEWLHLTKLLLFFPAYYINYMQKHFLTP